MQIAKCKTIETYNSEHEANGYIIELAKDGNKTISYMNILFPKAFKGYHVHTERTNRIYCISGEVAIYTLVDEPQRHITVTPLSANSGEMISIPPQTPTAIENIAMGNSVLIFFPDPPYNPANTGEMIPLTREEVERSVLE